MLHKFLLLLSIGFFLEPVYGQDSILVEAIRENTHIFNISEDKFYGPGATVLRKAIPENQFLLVGEQHGIREVGQFTKVLFLEAHPSDFQYLCLETDPFIAGKLEELAKADLGTLQSFCEDLPFAIPFYNNPDDYYFLRDVVEKSSAEPPVIWGVDQVFVAAPRYIFMELMDMATNEEARALANEYLEKGREGIDKFINTGDQSASLLATLGPEDYQKLFEAFGDDKQARSTRMIRGIQKTQEIYGYYYAGRQYDNNSTRVRLMKTQFLDYYNQARKLEEFPKVVFKFGATHTYRGLSYYDQFDLGNLVSELAEMNGTGSLHIQFTGIKGKAQNSLAGVKEFDNREQIHPLIWDAIKEKTIGKDWVLVDLRPLRHQFNSLQIKPLRDIVYGNDMYVFVPNATPVDSYYLSK